MQELAKVLWILAFLIFGAFNLASASALFKGEAKWSATFVDAKNLVTPGDLSDLSVGFFGRPLDIGETAEFTTGIMGKSVGNSSFAASDRVEEEFWFETEADFDTFEVIVDLELHVELETEVTDISREAAQASFQYNFFQHHDLLLINGGCFLDGCVREGFLDGPLIATGDELVERTFKERIVISFPQPTDTIVIFFPELQLNGLAVSVLEPTTLALLGLGLAGLGFSNRRLHKP